MIDPGIRLAIAMILWTCLQAALLLGIARLMKIEDRSYGRAMITTLLGGVAMVVLFFINLIIPAGELLVFFGGMIVSAFIMRPIFETTFGKAIQATILAWFFGFFLFVAILALIVQPVIA
jgi:hypothetical protein